LDELDTVGYISVRPGTTVEDLEDEAKQAATTAVVTSQPGVGRSNYSSA
jgi:hypothetical protein